MLEYFVIFVHISAITLENLPYALTEKLIGQLNERARWKAIAAHMKMTTKEVREIGQ